MPPPQAAEHSPQSSHPPTQSCGLQHEWVLQALESVEGQPPPHWAFEVFVNVLVCVPPPQLAEHAP